MTFKQLQYVISIAKNKSINKAAEEVFSTYDYKKTIKASDRATVLNLMVGLNG